MSQLDFLVHARDHLYSYLVRQASKQQRDAERKRARAATNAICRLRADIGHFQDGVNRRQQHKRLTVDKQRLNLEKFQQKYTRLDNVKDMQKNEKKKKKGRTLKVDESPVHRRHARRV